MDIQEVKDLASFKTIVLEGSADKLIVVIFTTTEYGPYHEIEPNLKEMPVGELYGDGVKFVKVNVEDAPDIVEDQDIEPTPQFCFFKYGAKVDVESEMDIEVLMYKIKAFL